MGDLYAKGKRVLGSLTHALAVACNDKNGNKSNVQKELNSVQKELEVVKEEAASKLDGYSNPTVVALVSNSSAYEDESGEYILADSPTGLNLLEDAETYTTTTVEGKFYRMAGADSVSPFKKGAVPMTFSKTEAYNTTDTTYFGETYTYGVDNFKTMTVSVTNVQTAYSFSVSVSGKRADGTSKSLASKGWNTSSLAAKTVDISDCVTVSVSINQVSDRRPAKRYSISFS